MFHRALAASLVAASFVAIGTDSPASAVDVATGAQLRSAITDANGDSSITEIVITAAEINLGLCNDPAFGVDLDNANASGDLDFTGSQDLLIRGTSPDPRTKIFQNCDDRVFDHRGSGTLTLQNVSLYGAIANVPVGIGADVADYSGGGVRSTGGRLVILASSMKSRAGSADPTSFGNAQTPGNGGGIYSTGDVEIIDSYLADNTAGDGGDGDVTIDPTNGGHGGAVYVTGGTLDIRNSTLLSNGAGDGGRGYDTTGGRGGSGGAIYGDVVTLTDVLIEDEIAGEGGPSNDARGGDGGDGGAVFATTSVTATRTVVRSVSAGVGGRGNDNGGAVAIGTQGIGGAGGDGGAIHAPTVTLIDSYILEASAGDGGESTNDQGGEGGHGGGIRGDDVTVTGSEIASSRAGDGGDGLSTGGGGGGNGGAVSAQSTLSTSNSYFVSNRAGNGGAGGFGGLGGDGGALGAIPATVAMTISDSAFDGNSSGSGGTGSPLGIHGRGGAIYNTSSANGALTAQNSTFVRNGLGTGREGIATGGALSVDNATLTFVTITDNAGPAAIDRTGTGFPSFDFITASVIGENAGANCSSAFPTQSGGFNVIDDTSCGFLGDGINAGTDVIPAADIGLEAVTDGPIPPADLNEDYPGPDVDGVGRLPTEGGPLDELITVEQCNGQFRINAITADQWGKSRPSGDGCEPGALEIGVDPDPDPDPDPGPGPGPDPDPAAQLDAAARFVPLPPERLFDTRESESAPGPKGAVAADTSIDVQITGVAGVPADAVAVVMNVAAINATANGFVTTYPAGESQPLAATHNLAAAGQTRPNLVTVPIGAGGKVTIYSSGGAHFAGDVAGYYEDVDVATAEGRIIPLTPERVFDTRPGEAAPGPKGTVGAGETIDVQVTGVAGVPAAGVAAVVMNLAGINATAKGFVTAFPTGGTQPLAAVLNLEGPGDTNSNLVMVPVGDDGKVSFFSSDGVHLAGDVTGYVTDSLGGAGTAGLFVPLSPIRAFDTRPGEITTPGPKGFVDSGSTVDGVIGIDIGVPSTASGAVLNVAGVNAADIGFVTGFPTGTPQPLSATLNLGGPGDIRPNAAILPIGDDDSISFFSQGGTHLVVDTSGYLIG